WRAIAVTPIAARSASPATGDSVEWVKDVDRLTVLRTDVDCPPRVSLMPTATAVDQEKTGLGNYFIANYPPFSYWKPQFLPDAEKALDGAPTPGTPLGLYLHIPFCRKRCKFCYFRVYTDKNAKDIEVYLDALIKEVELLSKRPVVGGRALDYVYFGGGTPSYLSASQLDSLMNRL